jgi:hypothetical protein
MEEDAAGVVFGGFIEIHDRCHFSRIDQRETSLRSNFGIWTVLDGLDEVVLGDVILIASLAFRHFRVLFFQSHSVAVQPNLHSISKPIERSKFLRFFQCQLLVHVQTFKLMIFE